ncbi:MAG: hypothetical protein ABJF23_22775 [Bryobacteraceae bacterium]
MPLHNSSLDRAGQWYVKSGIQEPGGGVARYYLADAGRNALVSTEITGYAISALVYLYRKRGNPGFLEAAVRAGRFLTDQAWNPALRAFPFEHSDNGTQPQALSYFFDCGIIVRGLLTLWRATGDESLLRCAREAGRAMETDFVLDHEIYPILTLPAKQPLPYASQWSRSPGCYQLKSALAWHELFEATGEPSFQSSYERTLRWALESRDGFLPAETPEKTMDRLHAYCYFLEALMAHANRPACRSALEEGISRVSGYLRDIAPLFVRSDVYAQLLRVRLYAENLAALPLQEEHASEEASLIRTFQCESSDGRMHGGFYFGRKGAAMLPFVNPVSTAFCLQALDLWRHRGEDVRLDPRSLI